MMNATGSRFKLFEQFVVDIPKTAIGKDTDHIPHVNFVTQVFHDAVGIRKIFRSLAGGFEFLHQQPGVEPFRGLEQFQTGNL